MLNIYTGKIKPNATFVYGLYNEGYLFYIGVTNYLWMRYKSHFSEMLCRDYIMQMRVKEIYPTVVIFGAFDSGAEAQAAEHALIRLHCINKHKLCNMHQNDKENVLKSTKIDVTPKRMPNKVLKEIMERAMSEYVTHRNWINRFYAKN